MSFSSTKQKNSPNLTKDTLKSLLNWPLFGCNQEFQRTIYKVPVSFEDVKLFFCLTPTPATMFQNEGRSYHCTCINSSFCFSGCLHQQDFNSRFHSTAVSAINFHRRGVKDWWQHPTGLMCFSCISYTPILAFPATAMAPETLLLVCPSTTKHEEHQFCQFLLLLINTIKQNHLLAPPFQGLQNYTMVFQIKKEIHP